MACTLKTFSCWGCWKKKTTCLWNRWRNTIAIFLEELIFSILFLNFGVYFVNEILNDVYSFEDGLWLPIVAVSFYRIFQPLLQLYFTYLNKLNKETKKPATKCFTGCYTTLAVCLLWPVNKSFFLIVGTYIVIGVSYGSISANIKIPEYSSLCDYKLTAQFAKIFSLFIVPELITSLYSYNSTFSVARAITLIVVMVLAIFSDCLLVNQTTLKPTILQHHHHHRRPNVKIPVEFPTDKATLVSKREAAAQREDKDSIATDSTKKCDTLPKSEHSYQSRSKDQTSPSKSSYSSRSHAVSNPITSEKLGEIATSLTSSVSSRASMELPSTSGFQTAEKVLPASAQKVSPLSAESFNTVKYVEKPIPSQESSQAMLPQSGSQEASSPDSERISSGISNMATISSTPTISDVTSGNAQQGLVTKESFPSQSEYSSQPSLEEEPAKALQSQQTSSEPDKTKIVLETPEHSVKTIETSTAIIETRAGSFSQSSAGKTKVPEAQPGPSSRPDYLAVDSRKKSLEPKPGPSSQPDEITVIQSPTSITSGSSFNVRSRLSDPFNKHEKDLSQYCNTYSSGSSPANKSVYIDENLTFCAHLKKTDVNGPDSYPIEYLTDCFSNLYFYPCLLSRIIITFITTLFFTITPYAVYHNLEDENINYVSLTYNNIALAMLTTSIPITLFLVRDLNNNKAFVLLIFVIGLFLSAVSLYILFSAQIYEDDLFRLSEKNVKLGCFIFGMGFAIINYFETVAYQKIFEGNWRNAQVFVDLFTGIFVFLLYTVYYNALEDDLVYHFWMIALIFYSVNLFVWIAVLAIDFFKYYISHIYDSPRQVLKKIARASNPEPTSATNQGSTAPSRF